MSGAPSKAVHRLTQRSRQSVPHWPNFQNWPFIPSASSRADVLADLLPFKAYGGYYVPPSPRVFLGENAILAPKLPGVQWASSFGSIGIQLIFLWMCDNAKN